MVRKIIHLDQEKCNGCGACAAACHEGAIAMADSKACLLRDDYCDGLGDRLPACPTGTITIAQLMLTPLSTRSCCAPASRSSAVRSSMIRAAPKNRPRSFDKTIAKA